MKLEFDSWYQEKVTDRDAKKLFDESCLCYKVGAYRASFIMSYLGFQTILKQRLLSRTEMPAVFKEQEWNKILSNLRDDNNWDNSLSDIVNRDMTRNPFLITDDLRIKYRSFRCIRNDCAHAKSEIVGSAHVETFWLFVQSNYNKFVINGGREGLLTRISKHYDTSCTRAGLDISPIIEDICTSMKTDEIPLFLKDVYSLFIEKFIGYDFDKAETKDFWYGITFSENEDLRHALFTFIKGNWEIFLDYVNVYSEKLLEIFTICDDEFKRIFWNDKVFKLPSDTRWKVIQVLMENMIIPQDEQKVFLKTVSKKANIYKIPPKGHIEFFKSKGYLNILKEKHFGNELNFQAPYGINYANDNWREIKDLITNIELDYQVVRQLNKTFEVASYGDFYDGLKSLLRKDSNFRNKYKELLINNNVTIPEYIKESESEQVD